MRASVGVVGLVALVLASVALAAGVNGTWSGRMIDREEIANGWPASYWSPTTLVVTGASVVATSEGKTMASHDSPTATSSCSMRFRFASVADGWRLYRQSGGRPKLTAGSTSGGYPEGSLCSMSSPSGAALRVRRAGAKLKAEYTSFYRLGREFEPQVGGFLER